MEIGTQLGRGFIMGMAPTRRKARPSSVPGMMNLEATVELTIKATYFIPVLLINSPIPHTV